MTEHEFGQTVMAAAGVEPRISYHVGRVGDDTCLTWGNDESEMGAWADRWNANSERPRVEVRRVEWYPDPLTPEGHAALWDALVAKGFRVELSSAHEQQRYDWAGLVSLEGQKSQASNENRFAALIDAAAQALGVLR